MDNFITKEINEVLHLNEILEAIPLTSEIGKKLFRKYKIYRSADIEDLKKEFSEINILSNLYTKHKNELHEVRTILSHFNDIETTLNSDSEFEVYEIQEIKSFVFYVLKIRKILREIGYKGYLYYSEIFYFYELLDPLQKNLPGLNITGDFLSSDDGLPRQIAEVSQKIKNEKVKLLNKAKIELGINKIKAEFMISRLNKKQIEQLDNSGYFYRADENFVNIKYKLKKNEKIVELEKNRKWLLERLESQVETLRKVLSKQTHFFQHELVKLYAAIGQLDNRLAKVVFAKKYNCCLPEISEEKVIELQRAENLVLKKYCEQNHFTYQALKSVFNKNLSIITGANMAGKTSVLKTVGQFALLNALAIPLPAKSAKMCLFDFVFFSAASSYSQRMDLSSFASEAAEINASLQKEGFGLFLIDEFARGTNPQEGEAFSRAVLEEFAKKDSFTIASTHFQAPTKIDSAAHYQMQGLKSKKKFTIDENASIKQRIEQLHKILDYSLTEVSVNSEPVKSALFVAETLGISKKIISKAKQYLENK